MKMTAILPTIAGLAMALGAVMPMTATAEGEMPLSMGNLLFVAVAPCRLADTRSGGGAIGQDAHRHFLVSGDDLSAQGGNASGCLHPKAPDGRKPVALSANFTAIPVSSRTFGWLAAYPADQDPPGPDEGTTVFFNAGMITGNTSNASLCDGNTTECPAGGELGVVARHTDTHLAIDVTGYYYSTSSNLITVSPQGGDFADPIAALESIDVAGPNAPSATNPYVILIGPGEYDLNGGLLQMLSFVSLRGSGMESTIILSSVDGAVVQALGVTDAELSDLSIYNLGGGGDSVGLLVGNDIIPDGNGPDSMLAVRRVQVNAENGSNNVTGILISESAGGAVAPVLEHVMVDASGAGGTATGIEIIDASGTIMTGVEAVGEDLGLYLSANLVNPQLFNSFEGDSAAEDVVGAAGSSMTLAQSHLFNGRIGGGDISCVGVTTPSEVVTQVSHCTLPDEM